jgi:hypothetical protein
MERNCGKRVFALLSRSLLLGARPIFHSALEHQRCAKLSLKYLSERPFHVFNALGAVLSTIPRFFLSLQPPFGEFKWFHSQMVVLRVMVCEIIAL